MIKLLELLLFQELLLIDLSLISILATLGCVPCLQEMVGIFWENDSEKEGRKEGQKGEKENDRRSINHTLLHCCPGQEKSFCQHRQDSM